MTTSTYAANHSTVKGKVQKKKKKKKKKFNVHEANNSLWDRPPHTLISAVQPSLNKSFQELAVKIFIWLSLLSLKASHSKMKCFSVSTFPEVQNTHTLSSQASFGLLVFGLFLYAGWRKLCTCWSKLLELGIAELTVSWRAWALPRVKLILTFTSRLWMMSQWCCYYM